MWGALWQRGGQIVHIMWGALWQQRGGQRRQVEPNSMATATYATVAYSAVWFINITHLNLLKRGSTLNPNGFSV